MFICCPQLSGYCYISRLSDSCPNCIDSNSPHYLQIIDNSLVVHRDQRDDPVEYTARAHGDMEHHSHHPAVVPIDATPLH